MTDDEKLAAWVERALADDAASTPISAPPAPIIDLEATRLKIQNAMRCSWGVYNVHPYLEMGAALCDEVERIRDSRDEWQRTADAFASDIVQNLDEIKSLRSQLAERERDYHDLKNHLTGSTRRVSGRRRQ